MYPPQKSAGVLLTSKSNCECALILSISAARIDLARTLRSRVLRGGSIARSNLLFRPYLSIFETWHADCEYTLGLLLLPENNADICKRMWIPAQSVDHPSFFGGPPESSCRAGFAFLCNCVNSVPPWFLFALVGYLLACFEPVFDF